MSRSTIGSRLNELRVQAEVSMADVAAEAGFAGQSSVQRYFSADYNTPLRPSTLEKLVMPIAKRLRGTKTEREIYTYIGGGEPARPTPNANVIPGRVDLGSAHTLPVYGQAIGGPDGQFIMNGETIMEVLAPPILQTVRDAYAVMISGESMEPRYYAGETAYVHPRMAVRRGDFVVVQIATSTEGEPPHGYVKQFVAQTADELRLQQLNPPEEVIFPREDVVSVHKIVMSGIS